MYCQLLGTCIVRIKRNKRYNNLDELWGQVAPSTRGIVEGVKQTMVMLHSEDRVHHYHTGMCFMVPVGTLWTTSDCYSNLHAG